MELIFKVDQDMDGVDCYIKKGELIRCKDCKYAEPDNHIINHPYIKCDRWWINTGSNDFCSKGVRKEE